MSDKATCSLCGEPMPQGEEMFKFHGYSGPCPGPPLPRSDDPSARYFLDTDNDSHWYIVPLSKREEWLAWCDIPDDDERKWTAPAWAREVGGSPTLVTFSEPVIR